MTLDEAIDRIIELHAGQNATWRNVSGYAPDVAAKLLKESRLDWLVSLARSLKLWTKDDVPQNEHDGRLILAWAHLGTLVEGEMKFFLSIYAQNVYDGLSGKHAANDKSQPLVKLRRPKQSVATLQLEDLRQFFALEQIWGNDTTWIKWVELVQNRRNLIHAYADRELGTFDEFENAVITYVDFLQELDNRLPPTPSDFY